MREEFDVWIAKYALTRGILKGLARVTQTSDTMIEVESLGSHAYFHGEGRQWHRTRDGAIAKARGMRDAKIKALNKQIAKLALTTFEDAP